MQVALKTVVDNFGIFAVEECLLNKLPELFKPALVFELDDENVLEIAGESAATIAKREDLSNQEKVLEETMVTLRRVKTIQGPGKLHLPTISHRPIDQVQSDNQAINRCDKKRMPHP